MEHDVRNSILRDVDKTARRRVNQIKKSNLGLPDSAYPSWLKSLICAAASPPPQFVMDSDCSVFHKHGCSFLHNHDHKNTIQGALDKSEGRRVRRIPKSDPNLPDSAYPIGLGSLIYGARSPTPAP